MQGMSAINRDPCLAWGVASGAQGSRTIAHYSEMKRNWPVLLILLLLAMPAAVRSQALQDYGYVTNADGITITITGYSGPGGAVSIPTNINGLPVTSIGDNAFQFNSSLTSVTIPAGVTSIGNDAFQFNSSLTNATIPGSVTNMGDDAFVECTSLTGITIPSGVISIGDYAFALNPNLTNVYFAGNAPSADSSVFADDNATVYYLPGTTGWSNTFGGIPAVDFQSSYSFAINSDETVTINGYTGSGGNLTVPATIIGLPVTSIGDYAFDSCTNLASVTIPASATSIGDYAFEQCSSLTNVMIPNSITNIGESAFFHCYNLTTATIPSSVLSIGEDAFGVCSSLGGVTIPNGVISIGDNAFEECDCLTNVTIPASVTSIGQGAFFWCDNVGSVTFLGNAPNLEPSAFQFCNSLNGVYFTGNAPSVVDTSVFLIIDFSATAYYLPGTTGWDYFTANTFLPLVLWNPGIATDDGVLGVQTNYFGFNITNTANLTVVVEACTNLANPVWVPLQTVTLNNGFYYFSEPVQTNSAGRFYGLGLP
jgi:hypothetical protein